MLRSIKQLFGNQLGASDGPIGHLKDFYFDDVDWAVRYLVVDTGTWLPGRQVLISPYSLGRLDQAEGILQVNLTRKQIEDSPSIETHKPVSRQYEEEYYRYHGWPYYWQGGALWGMSGFPILDLPATAVPDQSPAELPIERADAHLRSVQGLNGYRVQATEGVIGHVSDFMMDAASWAISQFVIKGVAGSSADEILIPTKAIDRISFDESTVFVNPSWQSGEKSPGSEAVLAGATG